MATAIPANRATLTAWSAAAATGGTILRAREATVTAEGIITDTRAVIAGSAFVAIVGATADGHDYLEDAVKRGASLLVVARDRLRPIPEGPDVVEVADTLEAWGALAAAHLRSWRRARRDRPARVVAITGSAGKTTTKELCAALLGVVAPALATAGNLNNRVGLPAVVLGLEALHTFAVLEMGMSVRGEIAKLAEVAPPDVAIVTNVGLAHAGGVGGSRADVGREKGALYAALTESGTAIVNADDAAASGQLARSRAGRAASFGRSPAAAYRLVERHPLGERGSRVIVVRPAGEPLDLVVPLVGEAASIDFVAALAAAEAAADQVLPSAVVVEALSGLRAIEGRAQVRTLSDDVVVLDDTYNANPASMHAALATLRELALARSGRAVAIIGEMKELGARSAYEHEALGEAVALAGVALAIGCGGAARATLERASRSGVTVIDAPDVASAAREAVANVRGGDVVLVKGSRSVGAETIVKALEQAHPVREVGG
jgi:UDP-N-acetylmuramoyl-tripeptide--D-alanyl-D-alanine ligase